LNLEDGGSTILRKSTGLYGVTSQNMLLAIGTYFVYETILSL
jgi:hypothetical protein